MLHPAFRNQLTVVTSEPIRKESGPGIELPGRDPGAVVVGHFNGDTWNARRTADPTTRVGGEKVSPDHAQEVADARRWSREGRSTGGQVPGARNDDEAGPGNRGRHPPRGVGWRERVLLARR